MWYNTTDWGRICVFSINPAVVPWELNPIGHNSENEVIALFFCCFTVCMKRSVHKFEHRGTFFFFLKCCDSFIFKRDGNMIHWWILSYVSLKDRSVISVLCSGHLGGISVWSPFFYRALEFVIQILKANEQERRRPTQNPQPYWNVRH